jgi:ribose transport system ATP-binding protein
MSDFRPHIPAASLPRMLMHSVRKSFGATVALAGVDISVERGQVLALVGENGAGKSTLMKILSGAHKPDDGVMSLDGRPYEPRNPLDARRAGVAMIYQELSLARHLSVAENIVLGVEPGSGPMMNWDKARRMASAAMRQLGRPDIPIDIPVGRLSVAAQQLVEIGRAVAIGCRVLVLDEPTSSLTRRDIQLLFNLVRRLQAQGISVIYISHFLEEVKEISDVFTVLRDGRSVGSGKTADTPTSEIIRMMVGREVKDLYPRSPRQAGDELLKIENVAGPGKPQSASLTLHRGEVMGIAGLVGAGRTELLRVLFGLDPVKAGKIRIGSYFGPASPSRRWAQGAGMVSEDRKTEGLALGLSIADNMTLSLLKGLGPLGLVFPRQQDEASNRWIQRLAVKCRGPRQAVGSLSGGNQQKVAIGRLLHHDVDLLLLDEPTRGIDFGSKAEIYRLIDQLATGDRASGRKPRAVLMVSSYLPELLGTCDRIAVMCRGRLGPARPVAETNEHQIMLEATGSGEPAPPVEAAAPGVTTP